MRILVTGSREFSDMAVVKQALADVTAGHHGPHTLVHGGAPGADSIAALITGRLGWTVESHPAKWHEHTDDCPPNHDGQAVCRLAGPRRNAEMVAAGADVVCAFYRRGTRNRGTANCVILAQRAGLTVRRWAA